jgi:hypothetical protein
MSESVLIAHAGTRKIIREELRELPVPVPTRTHQPLSHYEIVMAMIEALSFRHLTVIRDEYAISPDGMRMFGVMDLNTEWNECHFSIGLRNSNDRSMRLALTAGFRVLVCDNMAFMGDFVPLLYKHTHRLELNEVISIGVDRIQRNFAPLQNQISLWQGLPLADDHARLIIYEAFLERRVPVPRHLMPVVHRNYFEPQHEAFRARTLWSLSNAFTSAFKELKPVKQFEATAKLGTFLSTASAPASDVQKKEDERNIIEEREVFDFYEDEMMEELLDKTAS